MKTHKHGHGMTHKQIIHFSNRMASQAQRDNNVSFASEITEAFTIGWKAACKYFAHELRKELRWCEDFNEDTH